MSKFVSLIKTPEEIKKIREASHLVFLTQQHLKKYIKPGITLKKLDSLAHDFITQHNAIPLFLGYQGFPASICASVNNVLVHGIPNEYQLKVGDIISIDIGIKKDGYCGDAAFTIAIGEVEEKTQLLLKTTKECLEKASQ